MFRIIHHGFAEDFEHIWSLETGQIATLLYHVESEMFRNIEEKELLGLNWKKASPDLPCHNVLELVARFNNVIHFFCVEEPQSIDTHFYQFIRSARVFPLSDATRSDTGSPRGY
jgi:hypothetical protein